MAAEMVRLTSLRQAVETVLAACRAPRTAAVASVHVRHASALVEVLLFQELRHGWLLVNVGRVKRLAAVDGLLTVVAAAILPAVDDDPRHERTLLELEMYALNIEEASAVGGIFRDEVVVFTGRLLALVADARRQPPVAGALLRKSFK
ncbi:hypothetical protein ACP4OV_018528 [Aristida adscensionis]